MTLGTSVKPISYLKANTAAIIRELSEGAPPMIVTQNGEATAVLQDIRSYEQTEETLALLKILALGQRQIEQGRVVPLAAAIEAIQTRRRAATE